VRGDSAPRLGRSGSGDREIEEAMTMAVKTEASTALFLSEVVEGLNDGAAFLSQLSSVEFDEIRRLGSTIYVRQGERIFFQGAPHDGIFLIESGKVRSYYMGPSGREITLAYWTPGHFVGGPEVFRRGQHMWSGTAAEDCKLLYLNGGVIRTLIERVPRFAICIIEGLVAKSKCYSALIQMLGTRSASERLAQLLVILDEVYGRNEGNRRVIHYKVTHEQLANIVGVTRQWITTTLDRFEKKGIISVERHSITIERADLLGDIANN
jgi:CRP/FNR family transcriptional regulator, cyclic AMP receptor protein